MMTMVMLVMVMMRVMMEILRRWDGDFLDLPASQMEMMIMPFKDCDYRESFARWDSYRRGCSIS